MAHNKTKILIVEDEAIIAMEIEDLLVMLGYDVVAKVSSGEDAVAKTESLKPDMVLMDIVLQGEMDGIEAANLIRERYDVPVVYLTAYADDKTLARAKITGPFGYILKPFGEKDLQTTIEIGLYKHHIEQQLRRAVEFKSEILANVSHELRTPLTVVMGFLDLVMKDESDRPSDKHVQRLERAVRNSRKLLKLINNLLAASAIDSGSEVIYETTFKLDKAVHACVADKLDAMGDKEISIVERLENADVEITSDERKFESIMSNLLSNAVKFSEKGTVSVSASACGDIENCICIKVADEGIGIAPEYHETIFEKFKQIDGSITRKYGGSGLGLYIARHYARMLGGDIAVESELGKGSVFTVKMPMRPSKNHIENKS